MRLLHGLQYLVLIRTLTLCKGAVLHEMPKDDEPSSLDFAGSTVVLQAESREKVIEWLKGDVYAKSGVWDVDNVSTVPRSN